MAKKTSKHKPLKARAKPTKRPPPKNPLLREMRLRENRGQASEIARFLNIERTAVWQWKDIPPRHVAKLTKFFKKSPHEIRPDIFPR